MPDEFIFPRISPTMAPFNLNVEARQRQNSMDVGRNHHSFITFVVED